MPSEDTKILQFDQHQESAETPSINYRPHKYLRKMDEYKNNPEKLSTTKLSENIPSGLWLPARSSFKAMKNKHDVYKDEDRMKKYCESLQSY